MKLLYRLTPLLLSILLIGCTANPAQHNQAPSGSAFAPAGAGFTVNMPGKVKSEVDSNNTHFFHCETGDASYVATYTDLGPRKHLSKAKINRILDAFAPHMRKEGSKVLSQKTIAMDGHAARDVRVRLKGGAFMHTRITLVGPRLFQVVVVTDMKHANAPQIEKFLDSFHITMH